MLTCYPCIVNRLDLYRNVLSLRSATTMRIYPEPCVRAVCFFLTDAAFRDGHLETFGSIVYFTDCSHD
ncbi:hypothetical protein EMIT043CA1_180035 [Pseudomonas brassicacearum]